MASKKAAKKVAAKKGAAKKSAAKKGAAKHAGHAERDVRRAYEHMGRLESLRSLLDASAAGEIEGLLSFVQGSLADGDEKSAAELLRAGEHLAFGSLAARNEDAVSGRLQQAAKAEFSHLLERAQHHREAHGRGRVWPLQAIYRDALKRANDARGAGALRRALEFARAAEALAHVDETSLTLQSGTAPHKLAAN